MNDSSHKAWQTPTCRAFLFLDMYKIVDIFGNETTIMPTQSGIKKKNLFTDYDGFVEKFEAKKTTDDCYTPDDVYAIVLNYVNSIIDISNKKIIRPFYPGGDYEGIEYPDDCIVIDNPPFSIITKICRFYILNDIDFFLFAPHLTLFTDVDCTHVVVGANIEYDNGAIIKTSFLTNLLSEVKILGDSLLYNKLEDVRKSKNKPPLPKYSYPDNILTVSDVSYMVEKGISFSLNKQSVKHCRQLDSQKPLKKTLFGGGFLISEKAAAEKAATEKAAAEKAAAEKVATFKWEISKREWDIINKLE